MTEPKIRFMQYKKPWNLTSVGEITIELNEYNNLSSNIPLMTSSRNGLMFQSEFRDKASTDNKGTLFSVVPYGKCTYRHMSDDDIFHFNINDLAEAGLVSKEYPVFDATNGNSLFLLVEYLNNSARFRAFCKAQKKGGTRTRLYYKNLCEYKFYFPSVNEQTDMEMFLKSVNKIISLLTEEVRLWEEKKKGIMQKIFSQEVRFKDENREDYPEWEESTLSEFAIVIMGQSPDGKSVNNENDGVPLIQGKADLHGYGVIPARYTNMPTKICKPTDLIMTVRAPVGYVERVGYKACIGRGVCILRAKENTSEEYLMYLLQYMERYWLTIQQGSTFTAVNGDDIKGLLTTFPIKQEQDKICECLSGIDNVITLKKQKLETWKTIKKGLLQQMFV